MKEQSYSPMMRQYHDIKSQHKDAILMFRLGDFYEMFLDDARIAARELDLTLTTKAAGKNNRIPLAGIPHHAATGYISRLIKKGYKVAICEQMEDPKKTKSLVKREVIRIVTPGTVLEAGVLDAHEHNYLLSLYPVYKKSQLISIGLAACDLSTGDFISTDVSDLSTLDNECARLQSRECLVPEELLDEDGPLISMLRLNHHVVLTPVESWRFDAASARTELLRQFGVKTLEGFGIHGDESFLPAAGVILYYLQRTQKTLLSHFRSLNPYRIGEEMVMDRITLQHLELVTPLHGDDKNNTLLGILDRTRTSMGARLLKKRILEPLLASEKILERLDQVDAFVHHIPLQGNMDETLSDVQDIERLTARISCRTANARDMVALSRSLKKIPSIREILDGFHLPVMDRFVGSLEPLTDIVNLIDTSLVEDPPVTIKDGGMIREKKSKELDGIKNGIRDSREWIANLQPSERKRTGISSLKVGFNSVFGYYIEVTRTNLKQVPDNYIRKQTLTNAERFITPELKEVEGRVLGAQDRINQLEFDIFSVLRDEVANEAARLIQTAQVIAEIDVALSMSRVSIENNYSRPEITEDSILDIRNGRHPVVEKSLRDEPFIPNDLFMDEESSLHLITGPNMAGKSTTIRQVALMVLMGQIGSFVPAEKMRFRPVDRIFTRVGASDDISRGHSTFMVEMLETANILHHSSPRSLIILDEIGRGTSTYDGLSIAWAVAEYIVTHYNPAPFTLFATHYHELTELADRFPMIHNFNISIREYKDRILFLRKIMPGRADKSYGIQVARLAGLPDWVIQRARDILTGLESDDRELDIRTSKQDSSQLSLSFGPTAEHTLIEKIRKLEPENLTPLEALNLLTDFVNDIHESDPDIS